jgi:hypothetical protein
MPYGTFHSLWSIPIHNLWFVVLISNNSYLSKPVSTCQQHNPAQMASFSKFNLDIKWLPLTCTPCRTLTKGGRLESV